MFVRFGVAVILCVISVSAQAQSQFKAEDVLEHFTPAVKEAGPECPEGAICLPKKKTRGVCIGSKSQCEGQTTAKAADPGGFDLLITFELGSDRLSTTAQQNLREFAKALNSPALEGAQFNVDGHTDARGAVTMNNALSERRARVVVDFLKSLGVEEARLRAQGYGESKPRNASDPFADINRRVEATIRTQ
ncbi:MAG: OmpA family protein [Pseudomonadota bacterium]